MSDSKKEDRLLDKDIVEKAHELIDSLENGDVTSARQLINSLNEVREKSLYNALGELTRELHDTLKDIDVGTAVDEMPKARNRLTYIIDMTEQAASKTMDGIEATIPIAQELAEEAKVLHENWSKFKRRELSKDEFKNLYAQMMDYLERVDTSSSEMHSILRDVLTAQEYQDLTGQAIKKVTATVTDMEKRLVKLVALASEANGSFADERALLSDEETKKKVENENSQQVCGQDEVDDLLSSLGF